MPNIRDQKSFEKSWWDWTPFNDCFAPTKIRISDIDGFVERHSQFLFIETKKPGVDIPKGQAIMFDKMVGTGLFTIVIIWGHTNCPENALLITKNGQKRYDKCDIEDLKGIFTRWFNYANSTKSIFTDQQNISRNLLEDISLSLEEVINIALETQRLAICAYDKENSSTYICGGIGSVIQDLRTIKDRIRIQF